MKRHKKTWAVIGVLLLVLVAVPLFDTDDVATPLATPALHVIAEELTLAKNAVATEEAVISFTADDFANALGKSEIYGITVLELPPAADGKLLLGEVAVFQNQTIAADHLEKLTFVPTKSGAMESGFRFTESGNAGYHSMHCALYLLTTANHAPTTDVVSEAACSVSVVTGASATGTLRAVDPDGDRMTFEVTKLPTQGVVSLTSRTAGTYRYTPVGKDGGTDSFSYIAVDCYGNRSAERTVTITMLENTKGINYVDLAEAGLQNAALCLAEQEIMVGKQVAGEWLFLPDAEMTRAEFLALAVSAAGYTVDPTKTITGFADDAEIPESFRACVAVSAQVKLVAGEVREDGVYFRPNDAITRAEASVILARLLHADTPTSAMQFADHSDIPTWAAPSVYAMYHRGVLELGTDGKIAANAKLTRADTAELLAAVREGL